MQRTRFIYELQANDDRRAVRKERSSVFVWTPIKRRENNSPKIGRGGIELDRYVESLAHFPARANDLACDPLVCASMFEHKTRVHRQTLLHHDQCAVRADALR